MISDNDAGRHEGQCPRADGGKRRWICDKHIPEGVKEKKKDKHNKER